jgi:hypothetical protein
VWWWRRAHLLQHGAVEVRHHRGTPHTRCRVHRVRSLQLTEGGAQAVGYLHLIYQRPLMPALCLSGDMQLALRRVHRPSVEVRRRVIKATEPTTTLTHHHPWLLYARTPEHSA